MTHFATKGNRFPGIVHDEITAVPATDWEGNVIVGIRATYKANSQNTQHTPIALTLSAAHTLLLELRAALVSISCDVDPSSSRVCELGTKSCTIWKHS